MCDIFIEYTTINKDFIEDKVEDGRVVKGRNVRGREGVREEEGREGVREEVGITHLDQINLIDRYDILLVV